MRTSAPRQLATAAASALICLITGCTTWVPVAADPAGTRSRAEIKVGDTVHVLAADGARHSLQVSAVGETSLTGNVVKTGQHGADVPGSRIEVRYDEIRELEVRRVSAGKTILMVGAAALVAGVAIASGGGSHTPGYSR